MSKPNTGYWSASKGQGHGSERRGKEERHNGVEQMRTRVVSLN